MVWRYFSFRSFVTGIGWFGSNIHIGKGTMQLISLLASVMTTLLGVTRFRFHIVILVILFSMTVWVFSKLVLF
ncbi:hypothetical protein LINPERHAP1_LOCUS37920 [Linum perenne]